MWGSKGYAKEVPPVAIAIPPTVIASPQHVEPVAVDAEREREKEREREGEEERSDMGGREEDTSSHSLTAVSVQYHLLKISQNCYYRYMYMQLPLKLLLHVWLCTCIDMYNVHVHE